MTVKSFTRFAAISALLVAGVANVYADVYGSISGVVRDRSGSPLPGVTVTVTAPVLPKGRHTVTETNGNYSIQTLPPATYTVEASLAGLGNARAGAIVSVDKDTTLNLSLSPTVSETMTVTAATPSVDMKSTEVNFNYDAKTIERLPLPRTYQGLFALAPGVAENQSWAPTAGGTRQDNTFLLDGVNVTNPGFGYLSLGNTDTNELDIQDFNVKRAGFSAEFGRSSGMVVNAVTKSGTNRVEGAVRQEYQPGSWASSAKDASFNANTDRSRTAANIGGPIWRDHVFGYFSGRYEKTNTTGRTNFLGPVPDDKQTVKEIFGKLTATPTSSQFISASYRNIPLAEPFSGVGTFDLPEVANDFKNTNRVATVDYNWSATTNTLVEAKVLRLNENNHFVAHTDLGFKPTFNPKDLRHMGAVTIPDPNGSGVNVNAGAFYVRLSTQDYKRDEAKLAVSQFFDFGGMNHEVKAGVGYEFGEEDLLRKSNGWGIVYDIGGGQYEADYYPDQPTLKSQANTYSVYVQDSVTVNPRLNFNVGVLTNRDTFGQDIGRKITFLRFNFKDEIQPRIGVNYNLRANAGDKIYANVGRYINMDQKSSSRSMAPFGLVISSAIFDATTGALISDTLQSGATGNAFISPGLKPTYTNEYLVGYATPFGSRWSFDTFGIFRNWKNFIEDRPIPVPFGDFFFTNLPAAKQRYYGVTFDANRRLADRWSADVNYTWSRWYGNIDLDASGGAITDHGALYNTASAIEDGPGLMVEDPNRWGPYRLNHTHVLKAFTSFEVIPNLNLGGYFRYQSGSPWENRGRAFYYGGYRRYLEPAGSHHTPSWSNFDMSASYALPLRGRSRVSLEARVLNLFDQQTALTVDSVPYLDPRHRLSHDPWIVQDTNRPNPNYGKPNSYAYPRRYIASVRIDF